MDKKKLFIMLALSMLVLANLSIIVSAYEWTCLKRGEKLQYQDYTCSSSCCKICTNNGWSAALYRCNEIPQCSCTGGPGGTLDIDPPAITINSPANGQNYGRAINVDLSTNEPASLYYDIYLTDRYGYKTLIYSKVTSYSNDITFPDGENLVIFKAVDYRGNEGFKNVTFRVDSKEPVITAVLPKVGTYSNGQFSVTYTEANNEQTNLHVLQNGNERILTKTDCEDGDKKTCNFAADNLLQGNLEYWFTVCDIANCIDSAHTNVLVDTVTPELSMLNMQGFADLPYYGTRILDIFDFEIDEPVTLAYTDLEALRPSKRTICARCTESVDRRYSFNDGYHNVDFTATDNAGNTDTVNVDFIIDSKAPQINSELPKYHSYGDGTFVVEYTEAYLDSVSLYYKPNGSSDFSVIKKNDCPTGGDLTRGKASCTFNIDGLPQGTLIYYFEVKDKIRSTMSRRQTMIHVDTVTPNMNVLSPENTQYNNYVNFIINIDEPVTLRYIDASASLPRWTNLCAKCTLYNYKKYFSDGNHDVTIEAVDNAGNRDAYNVQFTVI